MIKTFLTVLTIASVFGSAASYALPSENSKTNIPEALKLPLQNGYKVSAQFKAEGGLTGWILSQGVNRNTVAYTTSNGKIVIGGPMLNAKGENLSEQYLEQYAPKPAYEKFWPRLESSTYVQEGATGSDVKSIIYVFMDPNCGYCRLAWKSFVPYFKVGLQVRWIPVGFLSPDSNNKAAALITAPDAALALKELHTQGAKFPGTASVPLELKTKLDANKKLMDEMGFKGTPASVYKGGNDKVLVIDGMPRLSQIPIMTGLPEQAQTDPELNRFK